MTSFARILIEYSAIQEEIMTRVHQIASTDNDFNDVAIRNRINQLSMDVLLLSNQPRNFLQAEQIRKSSAEGTVFIKDYILSDLTEMTLVFFKNLDPSIYIFMLTKAVYLFTLGSKSNEQIPDFFKPDTKECINKQREEFIDIPNKEYIVSELQEVMKDFSKFENTKTKDVESTLASLKKIAYEEIYGGLLATKCLMDALSDPKYRNT